MPATPGPQSGAKSKRPARGSNGAGDGGRSDGTKHYAPPKPMGGKGLFTGTNPSLAKRTK